MKKTKNRWQTDSVEPKDDHPIFWKGVSSHEQKDNGPESERASTVLACFPSKRMTATAKNTVAFGRLINFPGFPTLIVQAADAQIVSHSVR